MRVRKAIIAVVLSLSASPAFADDLMVPEISSIAFRPVQSESYDLIARARDLETGRAAFEAGDYAKAVSVFSLTLARGEDTPALRLYLADSLLETKRYADARMHYAALPEGPQKTAGLTLCDYYLDALEDPEVAINAALEYALDDHRLWTILGQTYDQHARHLDAQDVYIHAMQMGADAAEGINNLGLSLLKQGQFNAAREKFKQAYKLANSEPRYDANARLVTALLDGPDDAVIGLDDIAAAQLLNDAGYIAYSRGDSAAAKHLFESAIEISPVYFPLAEANLELAQNS